MLIKELTNYINKNGYPNSIRKCFKLKNGLHSCKSYRSHLGKNLVDSNYKRKEILLSLVIKQS
jgi:hypothetical protein